MGLFPRKYALLVVLLILATAVVAFVFRPAGDSGDESRSSATPQEDLLAHSVEIWHFSQDGTKQWEVIADSVAVGEETVYRGISEGRIYTEDGPLIFQADEVISDESTGDLRISGDVVVSDEEGSRLQTNSMIYTADEATIYCPERVLVETDGRTVLAGSLVWNTDTGVLEMTGGVEVVLESGATATAESLTHNSRDGSSSMSNFTYIGIGE